VKRKLEEYREKAIKDEHLDENAKKMILGMIDELESMVNTEIAGSIALIKRPLSQQLDWYFTYGENRVIPIEKPEGLNDRDTAIMTVVLTEAE